MAERAICKLSDIKTIIENAKRVVIFTHVRPDGDAVGSALALSLVLDKLSVPNVICEESEFPSNLAFMPYTNRFGKTVDKDADVFISVDCADDARLGVFADDFRKGNKKAVGINIDHHISNTRFAQWNYVRDCSANCMNMYELFKLMGVEIDRDIATALLLGILTDSGNFSHDDVTEEVLLIAAELVKAGADIAFLNYNSFKKQPRARAELYAYTMSHIRYALNDRFASISISLEKMKEYGADNSMTEGFVDFPLSVESVEVSASIMEIRKGQYKISLRSKSYVDVNKIAGVYGGGGHVRASGCMLFGELEEVIDKLTYTVSQYLE